MILMQLTGYQMHKLQLWDVMTELVTKFGQLLMDILAMDVSENSTKKTINQVCTTGE